MTDTISKDINMQSEQQKDDAATAGSANDKGSAGGKRPIGGPIFTSNKLYKVLRHGQPASWFLRRWAAGAATGARAYNATLEECIYHADRQYAKNDTAPIQVMEKEQKQDANANSSRKRMPPGPEIRRSPLRWLWGAQSPLFRNNVDANTETAQQIDLNCLDPQQDADRDVLDRILLRRVSVLRSFFLITTDVMGPFQSPYVYSQLGYVPATIVILVMGTLAFLGGICINVLWLRTDSDVMPVRNFGYLAKRIWGPRGKLMVDVLYIVQLLIGCGILMLASGQSLGMIIDGAERNQDGSPRHHVCFSVLVVCICCIQLLLSPIRSLQAVGYLSFGAIFLALLATALSTAFAYHSPPNYDQALRALGVAKGPVVAQAFPVSTLDGKVSGLMNMVFAFGGSMIFPDIMSEMTHPWRFWKSFIVAQLLIVLVYCSIGVLVYAKQGQFTQPVLYYGLSRYGFQTVGNAMGLALGIIVALLYGNIVQKEIYYIVVRSWFKGPALMSRQGMPFWLIGNVFVWLVAFIVGSAIPQVQSIGGLVAAISTMQFSFTFPFLLKFSFDVQVDAMRGDRPFNMSAASPSKSTTVSGEEGQSGVNATMPVDVTAVKKDDSSKSDPIADVKNVQIYAGHRVDTWRDWSRWRRGLFTGNVKQKCVFFVLFIASLLLAIFGVIATIKNIINTFQFAKATSFGCETP